MADDQPLQLQDTEASVTETDESKAIRTAVANVYTFVRSAEINKTISSFTLDHYIDEAKRKIKDPRVLRAASDPSKGVGTRPSQLEMLEKMEQDFNNAFDKAKKLAEKNEANT